VVGDERLLDLDADRVAEAAGRELDGLVVDLQLSRVGRLYRADVGDGALRQRMQRCGRKSRGG
jgi:hypothetical protein